MADKLTRTEYLQRPQTSRSRKKYDISSDISSRRDVERRRTEAMAISHTVLEVAMPLPVPAAPPGILSVSSCFCFNGFSEGKGERERGEEGGGRMGGGIRMEPYLYPGTSHMAPLRVISAI